MPEFIVTTKHSVLSKFKVTARTKYDAVAALTAAIMIQTEDGELPDSIAIVGIDSTSHQIHSVGVVKDQPSDPEPEGEVVMSDAFSGHAAYPAGGEDEESTEDTPVKRKR